MSWSTDESADALLDRLSRGSPRGRLCPRCASTGHGQRWVTGWRGVSVAYAGPLALVALGQVRLGVDVESESASPPGDVHLGPRDAGDPLDLWVIKEAVLKAAGVGLDTDPREVTATATDAVGEAQFAAQRYGIHRLPLQQHCAWLAVAQA